MEINSNIATITPLMPDADVAIAVQQTAEGSLLFVRLCLEGMYSHYCPATEHGNSQSRSIWSLDGVSPKNHQVSEAPKLLYNEILA